MNPLCAFGRRCLVSLVAASSFWAVGCSSDSDLELGPDAGGTQNVDASNLSQGCAVPKRLIVLGDSITACFGVDGPAASTCSPKQFHTYLETSYAPGLGYENLAKNGAVTRGVPASQLPTISLDETGHAFVLIYVGGNDLARFLQMEDDAALTNFDAALPQIEAEWANIFAFFDDAAKFPAGVTLIMNNQYDPFDGCTSSSFMTTVKLGLLARYNASLRALAEKQSNAILVDQHTPFLGHGHQHADTTCPHYQPDQANWMHDLIHPNAAGHENLAQQWNAAVDMLFDNCQ